MKAAYRMKYCSPEKLTAQEIAKPSPQKNEILIKVHATTVNRTDCAVLTGKPFIMRFFTGLFNPKQPVPGTDFAGKVEEVGEKYTRFNPGDSVFGFRDAGLGSQAEYMVINENACCELIPPNIDFATAVASLEAAHYAYYFLHKLKITPNEPVLVNGASGGIGSALVQFLKYAGARITAVCDTKNISLVKALGALRVINYEKEDFTLFPEKFTYVFDAVGKSTFARCKNLLAENGRYLSSEPGPWGQNLFLPMITKFTGKKRVIFPIPGDVKKSLIFIKKLLISGDFEPVIEKKYPLEEISLAYAYVNAGKKTGNVIIEIH